jgi:hypothetical protein
MKNEKTQRSVCIGFRMFFPAAIGILLASSDIYAQGSRDPQPVDTRIDNMGYYRSKIEEGLILPNPDITVPPAVPSMVASPVDGPDVPVANVLNVGQSESSIFIDPNVKNNAFNSNNSFGTGPNVGTFYGVDSWMTNNGGSSFTGTHLGIGGPNWGDPAAAIDRNGRYYCGFITGPSFGQSVAYSTNQGVTWTNVNIASSGQLDKNHLWVDNSASSPYLGNVYSAWTCFGGPNPNQIEIERSTNGGVSWSPRLSISNAVAAGSHNQGVNIQTGPSGEVYVAWAIYDSWPSVETAIGFTKSTDGGVTYSAASRIVTNIAGIRGMLKTVRVNSFPVMAVDNTNTPTRGNIYIVWTNQGVPGINTGTDFDVYMVRSTNGGTSWSTPIRVNQDPINAGKKHWLPWIACDNVTGALSVVFYDDRNTSSTMTEVYTAYSFDAGNTWADFRVGDVAFTPSPIPGLASGYFGDYLGLDAQGGKVYPAFFDNRSGTVQTYVSPFDLCNNDLSIVHPTNVHNYYEAANSITATSTIVQPTGEATMDAGAYVLMMPGFSTSITSGAYFEAYIEGCGGTSRMAENSGGTSHLENNYKRAIDPTAINRSITLYPNPSTGIFKIALKEESEEEEMGIKKYEEEPEKEIYQVLIFDVMGKMVRSTEMRDNSELSVDIADEPSGVYFVRITHEDRVFNTKIIKE